MSLFKKNGVFHYDFWFQKKRHQGSTFLKNQEKAKMFVSKLRSDLALGLVGLTHRDPPPILSVFLKGKFLDHVRQNAKKPRTLKFYEEGVKRLCRYIPFTQLRLDKVDELSIQGYKDSRLAKKLSPATINGELRTLRKALKFADRCDLARYRQVSSLPGETNRVFVLTAELEACYLAACEYPLKHAAILILDLGLRPEECVAVRKQDIDQTVLSVVEGKSRNAIRALPLTSRTSSVIAECIALFPDSEWLFPGSRGSHFRRGSLDNLHTAVRKASNFPADFVLYSCRHTYGTRLAESGASVFDICYLMGHSSVKVSEKYIHLSPSSVNLAAKRKEAYDRMLRGESETVPTEVPTAAKKP